MRKKMLVASSLIFSIWGNSTFAESNQLPVLSRDEIFGQAKANSTGLRSTAINVLINTKNLIEKAKNAEIKAVAVHVPNKIPSRRSEKPPEFKKGNSKLKSNRPEESVAAKLNRKNKKNKINPNGLGVTEIEIFHTTKSGSQKMSKNNQRLFKLIFNARNLQDLTPKQRNDVLKLHQRMLKTAVAQNILETIRIAEDGGVLVVVGKGKNKGKEFRDFIKNNLTTKTHPAYQIPGKFRHNGSPCFFHTKFGHSTCSGLFQISKTNFDRMVKYLGIKDFSAESQKIMALEIIRTGQAIKVSGSYKGRGYVELLKQNKNKSILYGTDDWQSSPYSRWSNKSTERDYLTISRQVAQKAEKRKYKELKTPDFFQSWIDEVERQVNQ